MNLLLYYAREARIGIRRNAGASVASAALIFAALLLTGLLLLLRGGLAGVSDYLHSQLELKVYVERGVDAEQAAAILADKSYVASAVVQTGEQLLGQLESFFAGKPYLLEAFRDDALPDAVVLVLKESEQIALVAQELSQTEGIEQVVYPQQLAEQLVYWSGLLQSAGLAVLAFLLALAFMIVFLAIRLALYQRSKEIRLKLLLGARAGHVRGQFMLEGALVGLAGGTASAVLLLAAGLAVSRRLTAAYGAIVQLDAAALAVLAVCLALAGPIVGAAAAYAAVRRRIGDA
ncbi:cell division protein FtsX [Cohnella fermenti]|uniref:Cell division protein FtsX n=1 Tax=Cohnella fermenti TaxID=2565925 RepID=A0A4S4BMA8_9BACL|nr:permease-like cell division protein FtsX [Cohnella fermenti]THF75756.1 FtsX-like permease family protein [Cohnella fermenti]